MKRIKLLCCLLFPLFSLTSAYCSINLIEFLPGDSIFPKQEDSYNDNIKSPVTQLLANNTNLLDSVIYDTVFEISMGVKETNIHYLNQRGLNMHVFILSVDLNNPNLSLEVGTPNNLPGYHTQILTEMAKYENDSQHYVVAGVNGDFFHDPFGVMGIVYKEGSALKDSFTENSPRPQQGLTFMAVLSDGTPFIGSKGTIYDSIRSSIREATGGGVWLVKNYRVLPHRVTSIHPRTGVGITEGHQAYFIVVDGREADYSNGINYENLSKMFAALGVKNAINLDGGGSSTLISRSPVDSVWQVRNRPSDGEQRAVANSWLVIAKKR